MTDQKTLARRERNRIRERNRLERRRLQRQLDAEIEAARLEAEISRVAIIDEAAAPGVMRNPVVLPNGRMLIGPRVQVTDGRPAHVDPLVNLKLTAAERKAALQFRADWREVGSGVNVSAVDYNQARGSGDGAGAHEAIGAQIATRERLDGAVLALGSFAPGISRVVLDGVPTTQYAVEAGITGPNAVAWIAAGLSRLSRHYWPAGEVVSRRNPVRVRTMGPHRSEYLTSVPNVP